jgi:hypothetical protein
MGKKKQALHEGLGSTVYSRLPEKLYPSPNKAGVFLFAAVSRQTK